MQCFIFRQASEIGVIGAGLLGTQIALVSAIAKLQVKLVDNNISKLSQANTLISSRIKSKNQEEFSQINSRITFHSDLEQLSTCDFIIEAIIEDSEAKCNLFKQISPMLKPDAIIASNSSSILINKMISSVKNPENFIGMHFFNPVTVMKLVEIIRGFHTSDKTATRTIELAKLMGKTTVSCKDSPGFIVNRLLSPGYLEATHLVSQGIAMKEDVDMASKISMKMSMGALKLIDFGGIDIGQGMFGSMNNEFNDDKFHFNLILRKTFEAGFFGRKSGRGIYIYKKS